MCGEKEGEIKEKPALNIDLFCKIQGLKGFVLNTKAHERSSQTAETTWRGRPIVEHCLLFTYIIIYRLECVLGRWDTWELFMLELSFELCGLCCTAISCFFKAQFAICPPVECVSMPLSNLSVLSCLEQLYHLTPYIWHLFWVRCIFLKSPGCSYACMINVWIYIMLLNSHDAVFCFIVWMY